MPRIARIVVPGLPHHVTQRGNNRQDVFFTDDDHRLYLRLLREQCGRHDCTVSAYCLLRNHVHLIVRPRHAESLARAVGRTHWLYTQAINRLHGRSGHLWQNRFFSCAMQPHYELAATRYIERNPVRARMVRVAWRYRWSSAAAHCALEKDATGLLDVKAWARRWPPSDWMNILRDASDDGFADEIALRTSRGRPLASDRFLSKLETQLSRRLRPLPRGRPKKTSR